MPLYKGKDRSRQLGKELTECQEEGVGDGRRGKEIEKNLSSRKSVDQRRWEITSGNV